MAMAESLADMMLAPVGEAYWSGKRPAHRAEKRFNKNDEFVVNGISEPESAFSTPDGRDIGGP
jgi:hypothetical protein